MPPCGLQGHRATVWLDAEYTQRFLRQVSELAGSKATPGGYTAAEGM